MRVVARGRFSIAARRLGVVVVVMRAVRFCGFCLLVIKMEFGVIAVTKLD
jgi:hypothetical protein